MTTRYRVEYALKTHRRDQLIEWIKGLLAVPFVLHSQPTAAYDNRQDILVKMARTAHRRYAEILHDVCTYLYSWLISPTARKERRGNIDCWRAPFPPYASIFLLLSYTRSPSRFCYSKLISQLKTETD